MATPVSMQVFDLSGVPLTAATPAWVTYASAAGARTPPTLPVHRAGGLWVFTPTDADEAARTGWVLDFGATASNRYVAGAVPGDGSCAAFLWLDAGTGSLWAGTAPTWAAYIDFTGVARTPPTLTALATHLTLVVPSAADSAVGVTYAVAGAAGAVPTYYADTFTAATGGTTTTIIAQPGQPSTYQAALQRAGTAVLWKDYQLELAPPWLQAGSGWAWLRALGDMKDELELRAKDAVKARFATLAPLDALQYLADERGLPRPYPNNPAGDIFNPNRVPDTRAVWASVLQSAWALWGRAGALDAFMAAMAREGWVGTNEFWLFLSVGSKVWFWDNSLQQPNSSAISQPAVLGGGKWNSCVIVIDTTVTPTLDMLRRVYSLWLQWCPAHSLLEAIVWGSGRIWGPAGLPSGTTWTWGTGTWGSTKSSWIPSL